jgi:hypothetical protein
MEQMGQEIGAKWLNRDLNHDSCNNQRFLHDTLPVAQGIYDAGKVLR